MKTNNYPSWLVSVEQAKKLKEIGFDLPCAFVLTNKDKIGFTTKGNNQYHLFEELDLNSNSNGSLVYIPTYEQVLEWFRKKGYESMIDFYCVIELIVKTGYKYRIFSMKNLKLIENDFFIEKHEEVRDALINKLIEVYEEDVIQKPSTKPDKLDFEKMEEIKL